MLKRARSERRPIDTARRAAWRLHRDENTREPGDRSCYNLPESRENVHSASVFFSPVSAARMEARMEARDDVAGRFLISPVYAWSNSP